MGAPDGRANNDRCDECGRRLVGTFWRTPIGELFCDRHLDMSTCAFCAAPVTATATAAEAARLCRRCAPGAVTDQDAVRASLPHIRDDLHNMGVYLRTPVRVRLVPEDEITAMVGALHGGAVPLGATKSMGSTVIDLVIVQGLAAVQFGAVVAHEAMHAWLVQRDAPKMPLQLAEGMCELTAFGWLGRARVRVLRGSAMLREQIRTNQHPIYGDGFRLVHEAATRYGVRAVLASVAATGTLPSGAPSVPGAP